MVQRVEKSLPLVLNDPAIPQKFFFMEVARTTDESTTTNMPVNTPTATAVNRPSKKNKIPPSRENEDNQGLDESTCISPGLVVPEGEDLHLT